MLDKNKSILVYLLTTALLLGAVVLLLNGNYRIDKILRSNENYIRSIRVER